MSSPCDNAIQCNNETYEISTESNTNSFSHNFSGTIGVSGNNFIPYTLKFNRSFTANHGWNRSQAPTAYYTEDGVEFFPCRFSGSNDPYASVSEDASCTKYIPYYINHVQNIYVYRKVEESLNFAVSSGGRLTLFQCSQTRKTLLHTMLIPNTIKTNVTETFILKRNGVESTLATVSYQYNPFEGAATKAQSYGINGGVDCTPPTPDTEGVGLILLLPNPGKKCLLVCDPANRDPLYYGFYDYTAVDNGDFGNGVTELARKDGGYFFFYPHWIREMFGGGYGLENPMIRDAADYQVANLEAAAIAGSAFTPLPFNGTYAVPDPPTYNLPFGSFAWDTKENFVYSCLLKFGDKCPSDKIYTTANYCSFGDLYDLVFTKNNITATPDKQVYYPIVPSSETKGVW